MKPEIPSPSSSLYRPCKGEKDAADGQPASPSLNGKDGSGNNASIDHGESEDIAADLFKEMLQYSEEELESWAKAVRWKLDLIVVPLVRNNPSLLTFSCISRSERSIEPSAYDFFLMSRLPSHTVFSS